MSYKKKHGERLAKVFAAYGIVDRGEHSKVDVARAMGRDASVLSRWLAGGCIPNEASLELLADAIRKVTDRPCRVCDLEAPWPDGVTVIPVGKREWSYLVGVSMTKHGRYRSLAGALAHARANR